jgi:hypothetical protein
MHVSIQLFALCVLSPDLPTVLTLVLIQDRTDSGLGFRGILLTLVLIQDCTLNPRLDANLVRLSLMFLLIIQVSHEGVRLAFSMGEDERNVIRYDEFISMVSILSSFIPLSSSSISSNVTLARMVLHRSFCHLPSARMTFI